MRSDSVGDTKYPNCPDPAYTDSDLETIVDVCERLFLFGSRSPSDLRASMNNALKNGFFQQVDDPPQYLPMQGEIFSKEFTDWIHTVVKARIQRRATSNPEEVLRRDLAVCDELEQIALRYVTRNSGSQGDPKLTFSGMDFVMRVQDKRHKLMGLDQTSLILTNDPAATVAGRVLNALLTQQGADKKAWMLKETVKPELLESMKPDEQALALLRARELNDEPTDEQTDTTTDGNVDDAVAPAKVDDPAEDTELGMAGKPDEPVPLPDRN